ncbi:MAG TPA: MerR family transcriptional regulator [Nevskiaceae bacterium]|nr:MerR family transcriptional regulator [Nevskiaceae bacterium]
MKTTTELAPLPEIPDKRYFTIGEVSKLCAVKPHVLRYWEREFTQLHPVKRRGNRRYYQQSEVLLVRHIRSLLYEQGFTINGARQQLKAPNLPPPAANDAPPVDAAESVRELAARGPEGRKLALHNIRSELEDLLNDWPH